MGIKRYHDRVLDRISNGLSETACELHRMEMQQLSRRAVAACQFQEMLDGLKVRIARRADLRTGSRMAMAGVDCPSRAA